MEITRDLVMHLEALARLDLSEAERESALRELGRILGYMAQLDELAVEAINPTEQVAESGAPLREDEPRASLSRAAALACAPDESEGAFRVPPAIGGEDEVPHA